MATSPDKCCQKTARLIRGTLGSALTATTASVTISNPVSMDGGQLPTGTITGYNVYTTVGFAGASGAQCVVAWNANTSHYEFIWVEGISPTPCILYDDVSPGDTDKYAWQCKIDSGSIVADELLAKVQVSDGILKNARAYGSNHSGYTTTTAARAWYSTGPDGKNHIVAINWLAKRCQASLAAALVSTGASVSVDGVIPIDGGQSPVASSSGTLTAYNRLNTSSSGGYEGVDNETCWIEWDEYNDKWWIYDMACKES